VLRTFLVDIERLGMIRRWRSLPVESQRLTLLVSIYDWHVRNRAMHDDDSDVGRAA
jgi:hypothetical protein